MRRTVLAVLGGLVAGAGLHVLIVLLVPTFAVSNAWSDAALLGQDGAFHLLPPVPSGPQRSLRDPYLVEAVCRFSTEAAPIRIKAQFPDGFWSVAIFDRNGRNIYSLNDGAGDRSQLDLVIRAQGQRGDAGAQATRSGIDAALPIDSGLVVLRSFASDAAAKESAQALLAAADCNAPL